jgi:hypothetical protein
MRKTILIFAALPALLFAGSSAASPMKPGLWEMSMGADQMPTMPKLSPEQIEQMRKAGVEMPTVQNGRYIVKVCVTKEMAASERPPVHRSESGCQTRNFQHSGTDYSLEEVCDGPFRKGTAFIKGSFNGSEGISTTYDFKGTERGQPVNRHHDVTGKWVSADCGSIKPPATPAAATK